MVKIREIIISGTDYYLDTIVGYDGEHNITNLNIKLPSELISVDIDYYTVEFETSEGNVISSGHLQQTGGYVITPIWQQITKSGVLKFQVKAWALTGSTINKIGMTPLMSRVIGESVDGDAVLLDEEVSGLMAELQSLIANYPVTMGTYTEGTEWKFELIDGVLNITYVSGGIDFGDLTGNGLINFIDGVLGVDSTDYNSAISGKQDVLPNIDSVLKLGEKEDGTPTFDGMPISGVNLKEYDYVTDLDDDENLIIAQVKMDIGYWRYSKPKLDSILYLVDAPNFQNKDTVFDINYKIGTTIFNSICSYSVSFPLVNEQGLSAFLVATETTNDEIVTTTYYSYTKVNATADINDETVSLLAGWNKIVSVADGETPDVLTHIGNSLVGEFDAMTEISILTSDVGITQANDFFTTNTNRIKSSDLYWIRYKGIYIKNSLGNWVAETRTGLQPIVSTTYNQLNSLEEVGLLANVINDAYKDKAPIVFTNSLYASLYLNPSFEIPTYNGITMFATGSVVTQLDVLLYGQGTPTVPIPHVQLKLAPSAIYYYYVNESVTASNGGGKSFFLSIGWNKVVNFNTNPASSIVQFSELPVFTEMTLSTNTEIQLYYFGFIFSTSIYEMMKSGIYRKTSSGWVEHINNNAIQKTDLTQNISSISTINEVPSALAVSNKFDALKGNFVNRYVVGTNGDFTTIQSAIIWLNNNMLAQSELFLDSNGYNISDTITINLPYHLSIRGFDAKSINIQADTGLTNKPMFEIESDVWFERLTFDGTTLANYGELSTENALNISSGGYIELSFINYLGFYKQINQINANATSNLWIFNSIFAEPINSAIYVDSADCSIIDVEINTFESCPTAINLHKGSVSVMKIINNVFNNPLLGVAVAYNPDPAGIATDGYYNISDHPAIIGNSWNEVGTLFSGIDLDRIDGRDSNIFISSNNGWNDELYFLHNNLDGLNADGYQHLTLLEKNIAIPTVTAYNTTLTLGGANTHTTTGNVQFSLPTATNGLLGEFVLVVSVVNASHAITWSSTVAWRGAISYTFGIGTHLVYGFYDTINSRWSLSAALFGTV